MRNFLYFVIGVLLALNASFAFAGIFKPSGPSALKGDKVGIWFGGESKPTTTYTVKSTPRVEKTADGTDITLHRNLDFKHKTTYGDITGTVVEAVKLNRNQIIETLSTCIRGGPVCVAASLISAELIKAGWEWMHDAQSYVLPDNQPKIVTDISKYRSWRTTGNSWVGYRYYSSPLTTSMAKEECIAAFGANRCGQPVVEVSTPFVRIGIPDLMYGGRFNWASEPFNQHLPMSPSVTRPASDSDISKLSDSLIKNLNPDSLFDFLNKGQVESDGSPSYVPHEGRTPDVKQKNSITMKPDGTVDEENRTCYSRVMVDSTGKVKTDKICTTSTTSTKPDGSKETTNKTETEPDPDSPEDRPGKPPAVDPDAPDTGGSLPPSPPVSCEQLGNCDWLKESTATSIFDWMRETPTADGDTSNLNKTDKFDISSQLRLGQDHFFSGGQCPKPIQISVSGAVPLQLELPYEPMCRFVLMVRPMLLALGALASLFIIFGRR